LVINECFLFLFIYNGDEATSALAGFSCENSIPVELEFGDLARKSTCPGRLDDAFFKPGKPVEKPSE